MLNEDPEDNSMAGVSDKTIQMMAVVVEAVAQDPCEMLDDGEQEQDCREETSHQDDWCVTCMARAAWEAYSGE
jgi:hypothetical protein